ncbi:hypothetical protein ACHAWF_007151 [Thalassiosira exigua]
MAACDLGQMMLYNRSVLWDLDIPQEALTLLYEGNDPTTRTRHMDDIEYFILCKSIEGAMLKT